MLLIKKFHDYYDTALGTGVDKTIVFNRLEYKLPHKNQELIDIMHRLRLNLSGELSCEIIGFCGKVYPVVRYRHWDNTIYKLPKGEKAIKDKWDISTHVYFYSYESLVAWSDFETVISRDSIFPINSKNSRGRRTLKEFFELSGTTKFENLFLDNKVVLFKLMQDSSGPNARSSGDMLVNCQLKNMNFMKIKDSFTAFQDIMMYISGVLGSPNNPMIEISDVDMLEAKGFDKITSFRKAPTKKR